jgi:hypothetical protein
MSPAAKAAMSRKLRAVWAAKKESLSAAIRRCQGSCFCREKGVLAGRHLRHPLVLVHCSSSFRMHLPRSSNTVG